MIEYIASPELDTIDKERLCDIICEDDDKFIGKMIEQHIDDSWRHGNRYNELWEIEVLDETGEKVIGTSGRYFQIHYQETGDGEYNTLHELEYRASEVTVTERQVMKIVRDTKEIREIKD